MKKLNLGCGSDYREGWVNLDIGSKDVYGGSIRPDVVHDLNKYPYPFRNKDFDKILSIGVLEHMRDLEKHVKEISRIAKQGCRVKILVPYFLSYYSGREIYTHKFSLNCVQLFEVFKRNDLELTKKSLVIGHNFFFFRFMSFIVNKSEFLQNLIERFPVIIPSSIEWEFIKR